MHFEASILELYLAFFIFKVIFLFDLIFLHIEEVFGILIPKAIYEPKHQKLFFSIEKLSNIFFNA